MKLFIHPVFFVAVAVAVYYSATVFLVALILAVLVHELSHSIGASVFGIVPTRLAILPFGGQIDIDCEFLTTRQKNIVLLSGPIGNFVVAIIFGIAVWLFPTAFLYLEYIVVANFITGFMNLLPIYTFDGGKLISHYLGNKPVLMFSNIVFAVLLCFAIFKFNLLLTFFSVIIIISINFEYNSTKYISKIHTKTGKITEYAISANQTIFDVYKSVDAAHPTKFIIADKDNKFFYESDLEKWLTKYPIDTKIGEIV
ncbi:MAG: site-2 protease family protein [Christensenellaceae bacterium]|nr:site-2 protease family protein [Christensenellaceae bacterium]